MTKSILAIVVASVLSGCVSSGGPDSQSAARSGQTQRVAQDPGKVARSQENPRSQAQAQSQVILGAAY
jgi:hypothetical protein